MIAVMAKKKTTSGKHATKRINIGVPEQWHTVLRRIAAKNKRSVLFSLIAMVEREAAEAGITDLPPTPWDESGDKPKPKPGS